MLANLGSHELFARTGKALLEAMSWRACARGN